jgi:osmotically-inducible protein OsmY
LKRLLALLVLVALGAAALYYWKYRPASAGEAAQGAAAGAREAMQTVGEKFRETKHAGSVKTAFELNRELKPHPIDIDATESGVVTLRGRVPNDDVKTLAGRVAAWVPGVTQVVNELSVDGSLAPASAAGAPSPSAPAAGPVPSERARRVEQVLQAHASLGGYGIKAREDAGRLVLTGRVRTAAEKELAGLLARDTAGLPVDNALMVGP